MAVKRSPSAELREQFIDAVVRREVLLFGSYTLKSGRISPYFFNAAGFNTGAALAELGRFYASALTDIALRFDMLFGPAYKGIPLVAALAVALAEQHDLDIPFAFNRKEAKDHGEGGEIVGAPLAGRVLIVDDVISAGTSVHESLALIRAAKATPAGVLVALDREERGSGRRSAADEIEHRHGVPVLRIAGLSDLIAYTESRPELTEAHTAMRQYRARYGVDA